MESEIWRRTAPEMARWIETGETRGIETVDVPRLQEALDAHRELTTTEFSLSWPMFQRLLSPNGRRYLEFGVAQQGPVDLAEYVRLTSVRHGFQRDWAQFLEEFPLLLGPVFTGPPVESGFDTRRLKEHALVSRAMGLCTASSFVGVPAVVVPAGMTDGLPQGVQVIAGFYREDLCLEAAAILEAGCSTLTPMDPRHERRRNTGK